MQDFSERSKQAELMDTEQVDYDEFAHCLRNLEFINSCTLAYRPTLRWIRSYTVKGSAGKGSASKGPAGKESVTILDIGSGGGDMMRKIWQRNPHVDITGVDMNPLSKQYAVAHTPVNAPLHYVTENLFHLATEQKPDLIISSLFTHHLSDEQLTEFIRWMDNNASQGWFINDLHRHPVAYYFIKYITAILPFNRFIKNDAAVSVARSFQYKDWIRLLNAANIPEERIKIRWYFPFRYCVECQMI